MSRIVAPPHNPLSGEEVSGGRRLASRALRARGWPKFESFGDRAATIGGENKPLELQSRTRASVRGTRGPLCTPLRAMLASRPQVRRDYPLSLSISISGGKETYQDSPSNGERTGKSPA